MVSSKSGLSTDGCFRRAFYVTSVSWDRRPGNETRLSQRKNEAPSHDATSLHLYQDASKLMFRIIRKKTRTINWKRQPLGTNGKKTADKQSTPGRKKVTIIY
ncbi:uncharacterized protein LOC144202014 [Stigmatopora nigra]